MLSILFPSPCAGGSSLDSLQTRYAPRCRVSGVQPSWYLPKRTVHLFISNPCSRAYQTSRALCRKGHRHWGNPESAICNLIASISEGTTRLIPTTTTALSTSKSTTETALYWGTYMFARTNYAYPHNIEYGQKIFVTKAGHNTSQRARAWCNGGTSRWAWWGFWSSTYTRPFDHCQYWVLFKNDMAPHTSRLGQST
jgi:hypothetical protein